MSEPNYKHFPIYIIIIIIIFNITSNSDQNLDNQSIYPEHSFISPVHMPTTIHNMSTNDLDDESAAIIRNNSVFIDKPSFLVGNLDIPVEVSNRNKIHTINVIKQNNLKSSHTEETVGQLSQTSISKEIQTNNTESASNKKYPINPEEGNKEKIRICNFKTKLICYDKLFKEKFILEYLKTEKYKYFRSSDQSTITIARPFELLNLYGIKDQIKRFDQTRAIQTKVMFEDFSAYFQSNEAGENQIKLIDSLSENIFYIKNNMPSYDSIVAYSNYIKYDLNIKEVVLNIIKSIRSNIELDYFMNMLENILVSLRQRRSWEELSLFRCEEEFFRLIIKLLLKIGLYTDVKYHRINRFVFYDRDNMENDLLFMKRYIFIILNIVTNAFSQLKYIQSTFGEKWSMIVRIVKEEKSYRSQDKTSCDSVLSVKHMLDGEIFEFNNDKKIVYCGLKNEQVSLKKQRIVILKGILLDIATYYDICIYGGVLDTLIMIIDNVY